MSLMVMELTWFSMKLVEFLLQAILSMWPLLVLVQTK